MYYIRIDEENENKLSSYCRKCGHVDKEVESVCVLETNTTNTQNYNYNINPYTKHDPTLPRVYNMECPNAQCKTNVIGKNGEKNPAEIIYVRYDDEQLKYSYICVTCDTVFTTTNS